MVQLQITLYYFIYTVKKNREANRQIEKKNTEYSHV